MTFEQQQQIRGLLENVDKGYLITLLISQLETNNDYNFEKVTKAVLEFLNSTSEIDAKHN